MADRPSARGRLWSIWIAIPLVLIVGAFTALGVSAGIWLAFGRPGLAVEAWDAQAELDTVRLALLVVGGVGGVIALIVAYRRQRVTEAANDRDSERALHDRFLAAAAQLGHDAASVRLAAVYALARLADDWYSERQTCLDLLCAYLRLPYEPLPDNRGWRDGEREVRLSIIGLIRDHLRRNPRDPQSWQGSSFDFTGAIFDGGDFSGAHFSGGEVNFTGARFVSGTIRFDEVKFTAGKIRYNRALFEGATVNFTRATFSGSIVDFSQANFRSGVVLFDMGTFNGGNVRFTDARFAGSTVRFDWARFSGTRVRFLTPLFAGGVVGFQRATFAGGSVSFDRPTFSGGILDLSEIRHSSALPDGLLTADVSQGLLLPPAREVVPSVDAELLD
jgi:hypothetical protein